jgi:NAD dependent epimerase/dehydratase family enzyme
MRAIITGATDVIGQTLLHHLPAAAVLSRNPARAECLSHRVEAHRWDPASGEPPCEAFRAADAVFARSRACCRHSGRHRRDPAVRERSEARRTARGSCRFPRQRCASRLGERSIIPMASRSVVPCVAEHSIHMFRHTSRDVALRAAEAALPQAA